MPATLTKYFMVSDSWEVAEILQGDAVICQDRHETIMEGKMSIVLTLHMILKFPLEAIETWSHFKQCLSKL